jgi:uncharacterized caspase-like protein
LQAAGFDVVGARDLDQDSLRRALRDFLEKAQAAGPDAVAFVYFGGYGLQLEGEHYLVPVDARIARDTDIPAEAVRVSDYTRPLAAMHLKASFLVLDAARVHPFAKSGSPIAGGLALVEPEPGMLIAFNAAPGTVAPEGNGPYGAYAQALAEMLREGGLPLSDLFDRVRLRVNEVTKGAELPWYASRIQANFVFFERAADAPPPLVSADQVSAARARPIRDLGAQDAYIAALERDTLEGYEAFRDAYPDDPMAKRVRAIIAARREAIIWRRTRSIDTPPAYWSYLRRYPRGPHAADARRRLDFLTAALEPPPSFEEVSYDVPPPPEDEFVYVDRPVLVFDDPDFEFAPPPPAPIFFLPPPPPYFVVLEPPPPPFGVYVLPVPVFVPVPVWVRRPAYVAAPPNNIIYQNIHNKVVINQTNNTVVITNPGGQTQTIKPSTTLTASPGGKAAAAGLAPSLPPSVALKANVIQNQNIQGGKPVLGQPLPQVQDKSLLGKQLPGTGGLQTNTQQQLEQQKLEQQKIQQQKTNLQQIEQQKLEQQKIQQQKANLQQIEQQKIQQQQIERQKLEQQKIQQQKANLQQIEQQKIQQQQLERQKLEQQKIQQQKANLQQIEQQKIQQQKVQQQQFERQRIEQQQIHQQQIQQQQIRQQQIQVQQQQKIQQQQIQQQQIQRAPTPPTPAPPAGKPPACGKPGEPACR